VLLVQVLLDPQDPQAHKELPGLTVILVQLEKVLLVQLALSVQLDQKVQLEQLDLEQLDF
jgi:hypothetical protein